MPGSPALIFTDLDGTLLDHDSYSFAAALPMLRALEQARVPVIPATSKTRSELLSLREELGNTHPFISENGAAVFIPQGYFPQCPTGAVEKEGFWVHEISAGREHFLDILSQLRSEFVDEFEHFAQLGAEGVARVTGLSPVKAALANQRDYSEPVHWLGSEERKLAFLQRLQAYGACGTQGGRFVSVSGEADKGTALLWLRSAYREAWGVGHIDDLAAGDSPNDAAMLEQASAALLVRSPHHGYPQLSRGGSAVFYSRRYGPEGWAEGVGRWLDRIDLAVSTEDHHG